MIAAEGPSAPVSLQCELLGVSRSGYYDWARRAAGIEPRTEVRAVEAFLNKRARVASCLSSLAPRKRSAPTRARRSVCHSSRPGRKTVGLLDRLVEHAGERCYPAEKVA
jgi:hypothetical protein